MGNKDMLSEEQLKDMLHAIGYTSNKVTKGKYNAYRNFFALQSEHVGWEDLVNKGLATKRKVFEEVCYHVSAKGLNILEGLFGIKIHESD